MADPPFSGPYGSPFFLADSLFEKKKKSRIEPLGSSRRRCLGSMSRSFEKAIVESERVTRDLLNRLPGT